MAHFFATLFSISVTPKWMSYSDSDEAVDDTENRKQWYSPPMFTPLQMELNMMK